MRFTSSHCLRLLSPRHSFSWFALSVFLFVGSPAYPQVDWTLRDPLPTTAAFYAVAQGNGTFVAVGEAGAVFTSVDGVLWTAEEFPTPETLRFLTFIQGRFYARGDSGTIFSSTDGSGWIQRQGGYGGLGTIAATASSFVTVGYGNEFLRSTDGNTWNEVSLSAGTIPQLVAASSSLFVATTSSKKVLVSADGQTWTEHAASRPEGFSELVSGGGAFIARGGFGSPLYRSVDGVTWTAVTSGSATRLSFVGGRFHAIDSSGFLLTSDDGLTWTTHASKPPIDTSLLATSGTRFVAVNPFNAGRLYTSPDAATWSEAGTRLNWQYGESAAGNGIAFASGRFLTGVGFTSTDGTNWTSNGYRASSAHLSFSQPFALNGRFFILQRSFDASIQSEIHVSADGLTGSRVATTAIRPVAAAYGQGRYVIVGLTDYNQYSEGRVLTSTDGSTWEEVANLPPGFRCTYVHFADNLFVAVGTARGGAGVSLYTSIDGLTWTAATYPRTNLAPTGIAYGAGRWLIPSVAGDSFTSTNGLTWSLSTATPRANVIAFSNGYFVLGMSDLLIQLDLVIATSADGLNWSFRPVPKRLGGPDGFAFGNGVWVAVRSGAIASSPAIDAAEAPSLTAPLAPTTGLVVGSSQMLTATASGTDPLAYQWHHRGQPINGATQKTYTVPAPTAAPAYTDYTDVYTIKVTNSKGTAIGVFGTEVFAFAAPQIERLSATVSSTGVIFLQGYARGPGPMTYQWLKHGVPVPGAEGAAVAIPFNPDSDAAANYSVAVSNASGTSTSPGRSLRPAIVSAPSSIVAQTGERVSFVGEIDSLDDTSSIVVQWRKNGQAYQQHPTSQRRFQLNFWSVQPGDSGTYDAIVSNPHGSVTLPSFELIVPGGSGDALEIISQPSGKTYARGESVTLTVGTVGAGPHTYQWRLNGNAIPGATSASLTLDRLSSVNAGSYDVVVTNSTGSVTSKAITITVRDASLVNLSARAPAGANDDTMIVGFVLNGAPSAASPNVLVRSIGPTLVGMGVNGTLADPSIRVLDRNASLVAENDNWSTVLTTGRGIAATAAEMARFGAFTLSSGSRDSAVLVHEPPAGPYTALVSAVSGGTGIVLNEIYGPTSGTQRLVNLSARARVSSGDNVLIAGFVIAGNSPLKVLIRGVGPTLSTQGIAQPLANPTLTLYNVAGQVLHNNDNWGQASNAPDIRAAVTATGAFPLNEGSHDAAMLETLAPGVYTVHVSSADTSGGVALVEIYEAP